MSSNLTSRRNFAAKTGFTFRGRGEWQCHLTAPTQKHRRQPAYKSSTMTASRLAEDSSPH